MDTASDDAETLQARIQELEEANNRLQSRIQSLEETNKLHDEALETAQVGTWHWDLNSDSVYWSDQVYQLFHTDRDDFDGTFDAYLSLIYEEDRDHVYQKIQQTLNIGESSEFQVRHRVTTFDGSIRWVHCLGRLIVDKNGIPRKLMGVIYDVTDTMNETLNDQELHRKYQLLAEQSLFGLYILQDGDIIFANGKAANMLGYTTDEIVGTSFFKLLKGKDQQRVSHVMEARSKGQIDIFEYELSLKQRSGDYLPVLIHSGMIRYNGKPAILGTVLDISERRKAEIVLNEQEQRIRQILEQLPTIVWTTNSDLEFASSSGSGLEKLGLKPDQLKGVSLYTYFGSDDPDLLPIKMHRKALSGESVRFEYTHQDIVFQTAVDPLLDPNGNIVGCIANAVDITELKRTQQKLRHTVSEKEVLLAEMHHRVKNNLALIHGMLDLQQRTNENPSVAGELKKTKSRVQSIAIIHEMLYASDELDHVKMDSYVERLAQALLDDSPMKKKVDFSIDVDSITLPITQAVPCGLIINELMNNALQHAFNDSIHDPTITLSLNKKDGHYHLNIEDNGVGLEESIQQDRSNSLGLNIVNQLIQQLKADCHVEKDDGTAISITFSKNAAN